MLAYNPGILIEKEEREDLEGLILIDFQKDFCNPDGSLYVKNAEYDCLAIAAFIEEKIDDLDYIFISLDTHDTMHIANPKFWVDKETQKNNPQAKITSWTKTDMQDTENFKWIPSNLKYKTCVDKFINGNWAEGEGQRLTIWPEHCLIGSCGHTLQDDVFCAVKKWEERNKKAARFYLKGNDACMESFSLFRPAVYEPESSHTPDVTELINDLRKFKILYVAGEASSHCVLRSIQDLTKHDPEMKEKIVLLTNAMSPVVVEDFPEFTKQYKENAEAFMKPFKKHVIDLKMKMLNEHFLVLMYEKA